MINVEFVRTNKYGNKKCIKTFYDKDSFDNFIKTIKDDLSIDRVKVNNILYIREVKDEL